MPPSSMPGFFVVVMAMGYELVWDLAVAAQLAAQLRASEQRFGAVVEAVPSAILLVDGKGMITLANAQAETVFGYQRAELVAKSVEMLIPERFGIPHAGLRGRLRCRSAGASDGGPDASWSRVERTAAKSRWKPRSVRCRPRMDCSCWCRSSTSPSAEVQSGPPPASATTSHTCRGSRSAGRVVRFIGARTQPALDGHSEQCTGRAAVSRTEPTAHRQARGNPCRHREKRSPRRSGDSAATVHAQKRRLAATFAPHQRSRRGVDSSYAQ